ncbi:MAG: phospholipase D-like domain-containing protein [Spirochaeta sp.]|nr:phospholipase D-like domain-containing protein [Spirochaeta sp.]
MDYVLQALQQSWPFLTAFAGLAFSLIASAHVIIYKRDSRASVAWVGLIWLSPFVGAVLYVLLGINRVRRRAAGKRRTDTAGIMPSTEEYACTPAELGASLPSTNAHLADMAEVTGRLTKLPLVSGNVVQPLFDGGEAYPAMLGAIEQAQHSITLLVFLFDNDPLGKQFVEALGAAVKRGVEVRVLIDAAGARSSVPPVTGRLRSLGVRTELFMSGVLAGRFLRLNPRNYPYLNLRNHRKIMVSDGRLAFTGGMNIREAHLLTDDPARGTKDVHFRLEGPVVQQLQATFAADWVLTTGEVLEGELWFPPLTTTDGRVFARAIPDGPDQDMDRMAMSFHGALAVARRSVRIVTPYFLPERSLISALSTCALRGVRVEIVLPAENNHDVVAWAAMAQMWQVLEWGCRVSMTAPPFDHSKLMVVDDALCIIGSSNWDPRSLRLCFELGVECYDTELAARLNARIDEQLLNSHELTVSNARLVV